MHALDMAQHTISISAHAQERNQGDVADKEQPGYYARPDKYQVNYLQEGFDVSIEK